ncbi:MAG: hypothetical protein ACOYOU_17480, partial [Kiritimatiellia bacterium]
MRHNHTSFPGLRGHAGRSGVLFPRPALLVCLLGSACLGGERAWAQEAYTNNQPPVVNSVAEPDSEPNTWAFRAAEALRAGNPDTAMPWLQRLLQTDPATLVSTNGVTFRPVRKLVMELIRAIPERTLEAYRTQMGISKGMPSRSPAPMDPAALEARYQDVFASDRTETGLRLAGLYLDQRRFRDARGVLLNVLVEAPSKRVPRSELLARLLVACARVGDTTQAQWAWAEMQKLGDTNRWASLGAEIRSTTTPATTLSNAWTMAYGGPSRDGVASGAGPDFGTNGLLMLRWGTNLGPGLVR